MSRLKKCFLMFSVSMSMLLVSTPCAEAQWYAEAAAEAALLAQQIAQFLQDLGFDSEKWHDVEKRIREVRDIAKTVSGGKQAYTSVNNILKASEQIIRTGRTIESYQQYLLSFGDNFKIERSYYIYKRFMRQTTNLFDEVEKTIKSFDRLRDTKPLQYLRSVDEATSAVMSVVLDLGIEAKDETVDLCFMAALDEVSLQNQKFYTTSII